MLSYFTKLLSLAIEYKYRKYIFSYITNIPALQRNSENEEKQSLVDLTTDDLFNEVEE
jgi:hypothetical protein